MTLSGEVSLEMAYYNPRLAVWEPVLEPIEMLKPEGFSDYKPWTVLFEV